MFRRDPVLPLSSFVGILLETRHYGAVTWELGLRQVFSCPKLHSLESWSAWNLPCQPYLDPDPHGRHPVRLVTLRVWIKRLRDKLPAGHRNRIETRRSVGYRFVLEGPALAATDHR